MSRRLVISLCIALLSSVAFAEVYTNVFQMHLGFPAHRIMLNELKICISKGDYGAMLNLCSNAVSLFPNDATWHYNLACALTRRGDFKAARNALMRSAELGFADANGLQNDNDLAMLRRDPVFAEALSKVRANFMYPKRVPGAVEASPLGETAEISSSNVSWDMNLGGYIALFSQRPLSVASSKLNISSEPVKIPGRAWEQIRKWRTMGTASGNVGDIYDNHDLGHSVLDTEFFPGLIPTRYAKEAKSFGAATAGSLFTFPGQIVFGNSSTANLSGPYWGSCARLMQNNYLGVLVRQYFSNALYVYPQHHDYLPSRLGDVFPTRTPYLFISPGSSWTDRPILAAVATALAAMRPETKDALAAKGMIAPTLQYLLRASQTNVVAREDYLTPKAHPVVFNGEAVDTLRLAELSHTLTTNSLLPIVPLRILSDDSIDKQIPNRDFYGTAGEVLFISPCAIAHVWRGADRTRKMILEAGNPNDRTVRYHWFVGQGDRDKIDIREIDSRGSRVEISVDYHKAPFDTPFGIKSSRVDIICVADDGVNYSAPSFVTWFFPPSVSHSFDVNGNTLSVEYAKGDDIYVDPIIILPKGLRSEFHYDKSVKRTSTSHIHSDGKVETISY
jgi:hypothetical protein